MERLPHIAIDFPEGIPSEQNQPHISFLLLSMPPQSHWLRVSSSIQLCNFINQQNG
jgi:hypothetical protein